MPKTLRECVPHEFFHEFMDSPAAKMLDVVVMAEIDGRITRWPGPHKNVFNWWLLANGKRIGWNENPNTGWSFPVLPPAT